MLHRDDLDEDMVRALEAKLKAQYGDDFKLKFAGDLPPDEWPKEALERHEAFEAVCQKSRDEGVCKDCGSQMDDWENRKKYRRVPKGWAIARRQNGDLMFFLCPACDKADDERVAAGELEVGGIGVTKISLEDLTQEELAERAFKEVRNRVDAEDFQHYDDTAMALQFGLLIGMGLAVGVIEQPCASAACELLHEAETASEMRALVFGEDEEES